MVAQGSYWNAPGIGNTVTDYQQPGVPAVDINHLHQIPAQDINHQHAVPALGINPDGGSQPHNSMQPFLALNYIIRDGT